MFNQMRGLRLVAFGVIWVAFGASSAAAFQDVANGYLHVVAVRDDGGLECWNDAYGSGCLNLPDGVFEQVDGLLYAHCALAADGEVSCFGHIGSSELDQVPPGLTAQSVSTGTRVACAIDMLDDAVCWGAHTVNFTTPPGPFASVAAGRSHVCGVRPDGTAECWGSSNSEANPPQLPSGVTWLKMTVGRSFTCGLDSVGMVHCFGADNFGQVSTAPSNGGFVNISTGYETGCAQASDGSLTCWGKDTYDIATSPPAGTNIVEFSAGGLGHCAIRDDSSLDCVGHVYMANAPTDCSLTDTCTPEVSQSFSYVVANATDAPADGVTPASVEVFIFDSNGNPVDAAISFSSSSSGNPPAVKTATGRYLINVRRDTEMTDYITVKANEGLSDEVEFASVELTFGAPLISEPLYSRNLAESIPLSLANSLPEFSGLTLSGVLEDDMNYLAVNDWTQADEDTFDAIFNANLLDDTFIVGEVSFAPVGGVTLHSPLVFRGSPTAVGSANLVTGNDKDWLVEAGELFIPEGTAYFTNIRVGAIPDLTVSGCACGVQQGCFVDDDFGVIPPQGCAGPETDCPLPMQYAPLDEPSVLSINGQDLRCPNYCDLTRCTIDNAPPSVPEYDYGVAINVECAPNPSDPQNAPTHCNVFNPANGIGECPGMCRGMQDCWQLSESDALVGDDDTSCQLSSCNEAGGTPVPGSCCDRLFGDVIDDMGGFDTSDEKIARIEQSDPRDSFRLCKWDDESCELPGDELGLLESDSVFDKFRVCSVFENSESPQCAICGGDLVNGCAMTTRADWLDVADDAHAYLVARQISERVNEGGNKQSQQKSSKDPISLSSGAFHFSATDFELPSVGVPFSFARMYSSNGAVKSGALGPGFMHGFEDHLEMVGDPANRIAAPEYCSRYLPAITCIFRNVGGNRQLYVFDPRSGVYSSGPGSFGVIRKLDDGDNDENGFLLREPGGIFRKYSDIGTLHAIYDERGPDFGLTLEYRTRSELNVEDEGTASAIGPTLREQWLSRAVGSGAIGQPGLEFAATGPTERAHLFAMQELSSVRDSANRVYRFHYETFENGASLGSDPGPRTSGSTALRRRRLTGISLDGESKVVKYEYKWLEMVEDAYLEQVIRYGLTDKGFDQAAPLTTRYEYDHEFLETHLWVENVGGDWVLRDMPGTSTTSVLGPSDLR